MIFVEPPPELKAALESRYRLLNGTDPFSKIGLRRVRDALDGKAIPATMAPLYFHPIESMERTPHIRTIGGEQVVIHDETFADTVNFLELTYVGKDRPLVPWAVLARVLAEFLYVDALPGLGLYIADRVAEYASQFADVNGLYARPIPLWGEYQSDTPLEKVKQYMEILAEEKLRLMEVQRSLVIFHEIGHALYGIDQSWREAWSSLGHSVIDVMYRSSPIMLDLEYGLLRENNKTSEEIERLNRKLLDKMVEQISCDWFALAGLLYNESSLNVSLKEVIRLHWRFMVFTELIELVRAEARQRTQNKIRFHSSMTKLYVRTMAILSILEAPEHIPGSELVTEPGRIREPLESINVNDLVLEFREGLRVAGHLMTFAVGGPATWERNLRYGSNPTGYLAPLAEGESLESRSSLFNDLFGDDYLQFYAESDETHIAPCVRPVGHLLIRSRAWANDYFANEDTQKRYASMALEKDISFARSKLATTFEDVTIRKARRVLFFMENDMSDSGLTNDTSFGQGCSEY